MADATFLGYDMRPDGIMAQFLVDDPDPTIGGRIDLFITNAELDAIATLPDLKALVEAKGKRLLRKQGVASKLDAHIGAVLDF